MAEAKGYWHRRILRRPVLKGAAWGGAGLAAAAAIGCGGAQKPAPSASGGSEVQQPKRGGTLVRRSIGVGAFALGLDPYVISGNETGIMTLFYQGLLRPNARDWAQVEPELAQKWEQPSQTEYIFRLAPGVKWHNKPPVNGRDLTATDVVTSLERARTNEPRFVNRSLLANVDKIEASDTGTVRITTKVPDVTTLLNIGDVTMMVLAPEVFEKFEKLTSAEHAIGTGAFILRTLDDVSATVVKNPDYWKSGLPYLDAVRMQVIKDDQAAFSAFLAGQIDIVIVPGTEAKRFFEEQAQAKKYFTELVKGVNTFYLIPNTRKKPYDDARVTRAFRLLMDHQEAVSAWADVWFGGGTSYFLTHALEDWDLSANDYAKTLEWKQPKDDAAKEALSLLSAAGFNSSSPLKFELLGSTIDNWSTAIPQLQQAMWKRLAPGVIQAEIKLVDDATARTLESRGEFEVRAPNARASWFDPDQLLRQVFYGSGSQNYAKYTDSALDQMIDKQRAMFNGEERKAAVKEIVRFLLDHGPYTPFASRDWANAAAFKVKDWVAEFGRTPGYQYERVWLDA